MVNHYGKLYGKHYGKRKVNHMVKGRQKSPSRQRYEDDHPVIAIRITRELYQELDESRRERGMNWADLLRLGVKRDIKIRDAIHKAYEVGCRDGYQQKTLEAPVNEIEKDLLKK